jgi:hypothetical protein
VPGLPWFIGGMVWIDDGWWLTGSKYQSGFFGVQDRLTYEKHGVISLYKYYKVKQTRRIAIPLDNF